MRADVADVDQLCPGGRVQVMHPRADRRRLSDLEVRAHERASRRLDLGRDAELAWGAELRVALDVPRLGGRMAVTREGAPSGRRVGEVGADVAREALGDADSGVVVEC